VFEEYQQFVGQYSDLVTKLPTRAFLAPLKEDEEVEVMLGKGTSAIIKFRAVGELQSNGKREVFFEANGVPRWAGGRAPVAGPAMQRVGCHSRP
jgi:pyruvate carboxylase